MCRLALLLLIASCGALAGACSSDPVTEVILELSATAEVAADASSLRVRVWNTEGQQVLDRSLELAPGALASTVPMHPDGLGERSYRVLAELLDEGKSPVARQRIQGGYVADASVRMRFPFEAACMGALDCSARQTCVEGACVPACVDVAAPAKQGRPEPVACAPVVWVDAFEGLDDENACWSPGTPCRSLQYALDQYVQQGAGTVLQLHGGSDRLYSGASMQARHSGAPERPTTLRPWPATGRPIIDGSKANGIGAIRACCGDATAAHYLIEGLEIRGGQSSGIHLHGVGTAGAIVRDCVIHSGVIPDEVRFASQLAGISVTNEAKGVVLENNLIRDNNAVQGEYVLGGIIFSNASNDAIVRNNVVRNNSGDGIQVGSATVESNRIVNNGGHGLRTGSLATVVDNVVCATGKHGIFIISGDKGEFRHNSIAGAGASAVAVSSWALDNTFRDNILAHSARAAFELVLALDPETGEPQKGDAADPVESSNLLFDNSGGNYIGLEPDAPGSNIEADPRFRDRDDCDLSLLSGSPALGTASDGDDLGARGTALNSAPP